MIICLMIISCQRHVIYLFLVSHAWMSSLNVFFVPVCSNVQNLIKVGVGIIYHLRGFAVLLEENPKPLVYIIISIRFEE